MGKLYQRLTFSQNWFYAYTMPNGKRTTITTGTPDKAKADVWAKSFEETLAAARAKVLDEHTARVFMNRVLENLQQERIKDKTVESYFRGWLESRNLEVAKASLDFYKGCINGFLLFLGLTAQAELFKLTSNHISNYRNHLSKRNRAPKTINHHLKQIRSILEQAKRDGYIFENPADAVKGVRNVGQTREPFTDSEIDKLLAAAKGEDEEWRGMILLGLYYGMRLGDAADFKKSNVNLAKGVVCFTPSKTEVLGHTITLPLVAPLKAYFKKRLRQTEEYWMPKLHSKRIGGSGGLSRGFERLMKKAGVDRAENTTSFKTFNTKSFHSLRHTCASRMTEAGISADIRMAVLGHSSKDVHRGYSHLSGGAILEALQKIKA